MEGIREEEGKGDKKEHEDPELQVDELKKKLTLQTQVNQLLTSKLQEEENVSDDLRYKVDQKEGELSHIVEEQKVQGKKSSNFITELEEQLRVSRSENKSLQTQKIVEAQLESRAVEAKQLDEKNKELIAHTSELEQVLKVKGDEILDLLKKQKDNEYQLKSKIEELVVQISILQVEVDHLRAREGEVEDSLDEESMHGQKAESDGLLESKIKEVSNIQVQMKSLKDELSIKTRAEQKMIKEKEALHMQVMDLESDVDSLHRQKNDLEKHMSSKNQEILELREENKRMHAKILELEGQLSSKEDELSALMNRGDEHLLGDVNQIKNHENFYDSQNDGERQEFSKILLQMEGEILELRSKIDELRKEITDKEAAMADLVEESKQFKRLSTEAKLNYQALERKLEVSTVEFRMKLEDNILLLFQRIKVAEKMHYETKENHKRMKETLEQENASLIEKLAAYESEGMNLRDRLEPRNKKTKTKDGKLEATENSLSSISNTKTETAPTKACTATAAGRQDKEMLFDEKVQKLELQLTKEEANKLNLIKVVSELKERMVELEKDIREKDKMLVGLREEKSEAIRQLGEEKREAIRQLCVLIDHHRNRFESLQQLISNVSVRRKKRS